MKKSIFVVLLTASVLFSVELKICYLNENLLPIVKVAEGRDNPVLEIFEALSSPPEGLKTFVPKGVLRAYFFVGDFLILDLYGEKLKGMDFDSERYFIHQVLYTIFLNVKGVNNVYIIIDGKKRDVLAKHVDIRFSFPREVWEKWPIR
ncbi:MULTISPECIES: GerMN domain-containing protein [unclassified Thermotoga]|uniref:GerMN domain-containing protein n=1 Tax=unclassified Thermotoga TaxID=2631113 RepID=UPI000280E88B|nr:MULTISPECIES: GerMN domain-containing protein [unclassified Thermotoga]AIY85733.1 Lipoprotein LpqB, GerMN domain protein [Thermotoga sp. 2812B]EJX26980.1 Lipoprotein LpqB, GerMN domain protein [Thermotoga sp. EMP]